MFVRTVDVSIIVMVLKNVSGDHTGVDMGL